MHQKLPQNVLQKSFPIFKPTYFSANAKQKKISKTEIGTAKTSPV